MLGLLPPNPHSPICRRGLPVLPARGPTLPQPPSLVAAAGSRPLTRPRPLQRVPSSPLRITEHHPRLGDRAKTYILERGVARQSTEGSQGSETTRSDATMADALTAQWSRPTECPTPRADSSANCALGAMTMRRRASRTVTSVPLWRETFLVGEVERGGRGLCGKSRAFCLMMLRT